MRDEAHVGLVDAHAEGDGRHHHDRLAVLEAHLIRFPLGLVHAGVIGERVIALIAQPGGGFLGLALRQAIDDAALAFVPLQEFLELRAGIILFRDGVADVGPVETGDEGVFGGNVKVRQNFCARRLVGRRRQRHARRAGKALHHRVEPAIGRAEIVPPLRQAVRLVDGDQRQLHPGEPFEHVRPQQRLGRDVEKVERARMDVAPQRLPLVGRKVGVERRGPHAGLT